jgi:hypothetical protein
MMNSTEGQRDAPHDASDPSAPAFKSIYTRDAVDVYDASRILECSQTERQRRVQYLVRQ